MCVVIHCSQGSSEEIHKISATFIFNCTQTEIAVHLVYIEATHYVVLPILFSKFSEKMD